MAKRFVFSFERDGRIICFSADERDALSALWANRNDPEFDSPATRWLRTLTDAPTEEELRPRFSGYSARTSRKLCGYVIDGTLSNHLSTRRIPSRRWRTRRRIFDDNLNLYESISDAAKSLGITSATVCYRLRKGQYFIAQKDDSD